MDLVQFAREPFAAVVQRYRPFADELGFKSLTSIPVSALHGDNVVERSARMKWHEGRPLLSFLQAFDLEPAGAGAPMRFPVQLIIRGEAGSRGCAGAVASGTIRPGDELIVARTHQMVRVEHIATLEGTLNEANEGDAVTLALADQLDIGRGDVLAASDGVPEYADQFAADLVGLNENPLLPGRRYLLKAGTQTTLPASLRSSTEPMC